MAPVTKTCKACGATLHPFKDECEACGTRNVAPIPWYGPILGFLLFVLLFLFAVDLGGLLQILEGLLSAAGSGDSGQP